MNEHEIKFMSTFDQYACAILVNKGFMNDEGSESDYKQIANAALFMMEARDAVAVALTESGSTKASIVGEELDAIEAEKYEEYQKMIIAERLKNNQ
jgi:hypothetical protein